MSIVLDPTVEAQWITGRHHWERLFAATPGATAYLSPEWTDGWIAEFGAELRPHQLLVRTASGDVIGTCLLSRRHKGIWPVRLSRSFINTDGEDAADRVVIEHNRMLCAPDRQREAYALLADHIRRSGVDEVVFSGASEADARLLLAQLTEWKVDVEWRESPFVDLQRLRENGLEHRDVLSANTRAQLARSIRRYQRRGPLTLEVAQTSEDALGYFDTLLALHESYWKARGGRGGFATAHRRQFHRRFIEHHSPSGRAQLLRLVNGDSVIGVVYSLVAHGHVAFYQSGFLYEGDTHLKPGLVTHHLAVGHYLATGCREYDFLPSGPADGRYKSSLSNASRLLGTVTLTRPSWRSRSVDLLRAVRRHTASRLDRGVTSPTFVRA